MSVHFTANAAFAADSRATGEDLEPADAHMGDAYGHIAAGEYEEAVTALDRAIAADPNRPKAYLTKGAMLLILGRSDEALPALERAEELELHSADLYIYKGGCLSDLGRSEEASNAFERAISIDPSSVKAFGAKGYHLITLEKYDEALDSLSHALELDCGDRSARLNFALALIKRNGQGDSLRARDMLEKIIYENDKDIFASGAFALLGKKQEMLALVRAMVDERPHRKMLFRKSPKFDGFKEDPDFIAIVGE